MVDYSKWNSLDLDSDDEEDDDGAVVGLVGADGGSTTYKWSELRTELPWSQQTPASANDVAAAPPAPAAPAASASGATEAASAPRELTPPPPPPAPAPVAEAAPPAAAPAYRSLAAAEPAAPDVPPPVAGDTAPGVDPIQYDIRKLRALDHINQITVAEKLAPPTFTFMEFRHPKTRQPTYQCQMEWQGRTQTGLVQNSKKLAKHSAAVEMIDQLSRDGILSITARS